MTPAEYFDLARERSGLTSDRQLADRLGISQSPLSQMRRGFIKPSDETMVKLAQLAGIDPAVALMDLNGWRVVSQETKAIYARIRQGLVVPVLVAAFAALSVVPALAANIGATSRHEAGQAIYYRKSRDGHHRRLRTWLLTCRSHLIRYLPFGKSWGADEHRTASRLERSGPRTPATLQAVVA